MKKYINKILFLLTFSALMMGCQEDDVVVINEDFSTTISVNNDNIVLEEDNVGMEVLTVSWTQPDFGFNAAAEYNILFDLASGDFSSPETVSAGSALEKVFNTEDLNRILLNLGAEPGTATQLQMKIDIIMSKQYSKASEVSSLTATAYAGVLDLTSSWGVVGSATPNGWGDGPDTPFYKTAEPGIYVAYINMIVGDWKIRQDNSWDLNYGSADGVNLEEGGADIPNTEAGTKKITFDQNNLTYTIETYSWGLVGDATPGGWGADGQITDTPLKYDPCSDTWKVIIEMKDGNWKVRLNNEWAVNYGVGATPNSLEQNGGDIPTDAGIYEVTIDFNNLTYTIVEPDLWGVVGSATENGWDGPDFYFTPDYCEEVYYAYDVPLVVGAIKFRQNSSWDAPNKNYGDNDLDGVLEEGGADIPVTEAGTYDIMLDFSNPSISTYTISKK